MTERVVYLNGSLVPESQAVISVFDRSVQYGDAVYDAARTFGHRPFKLREHFFFVRNGTICTSGPSTVLEGITRATIFALAQTAGIPIVPGGFGLYDLYLAEEAFLTATSYSILPVATVNGTPLREGAPGPITRTLMKRWSELVGVDIVAQALSHLKETGR